MVRPSASILGVRPRRRQGARLAVLCATAAPLLLGSTSVAPARCFTLPDWQSLTPEQLFNVLFASLAASCVGLKIATRERQKGGDSAGSGKSAATEKMPRQMRSLQIRFLLVFWLFKMADWLQGPYFYDVYASKVINGQPATTELVARFFLTGFGTSALLGAVLGRLVDDRGRKAGSLAFVVFYALSALSTYATTLPLLYAGRIAGGIGTSLLFSAPEAWFVGEHQRGCYDSKWLSDTFGLAYLGDSVVAIAAGQLAGAAAEKQGPEAPFGVSLIFLASGATVVLAAWRENTASLPSNSVEGTSSAPRGGTGIFDALRLMLQDRRILSVGAIQALFEGAMYIFVLQWPPALISTIPGGEVPFGKVFSCLMACCMIGSTVFGPVLRCQPVERATAVMLVMAVMAMGLVTSFSTSLSCVIVGFLLFEVCVGFYFPAIGTLRSKYLPDSHRGVMMAIFTVPLNVLVVTVMLTLSRLGLRGSLACSTAALSLALVEGVRLCSQRRP